MNFTRLFTLMVVAMWFLMLPSSATADPVLFQVNDFEDGTTQGWFVSAGPVNTIPLAPPVNVASGGPAGVGDN